MNNSGLLTLTYSIDIIYWKDQIDVVFKPLV